MVVVLGLAENRAWGFFAPPEPAPGQIEAVSPEAVGENYEASAYDASGYAVAPIRGAGGAGRQFASNFDDFLVGRTFKSPAEARKAFDVYQQAAKADKGILIGHGDDAIGQAFDGWQAFRIMERQWTPRINMSWIDGAVDAGKPVRLITPFENVRRGSVTWDEIQRVISRGGELISP